MSPKLSIVILNFNTADLLLDCLDSLIKVRDEIDFEIIVVDNSSTDDSVEQIQNLKLKIKNYDLSIKIIENANNVGFAKGNNSARGVVKGEYVLILNSDTIVHKGTLARGVTYLEENEKVGALSSKVVLPSGRLDKDTRRSFPTPWVALTHFSGLDKLFPKSKLFSKYWYGYLPENETHEVDVIQGAFALARREVLDSVGWYDEDYFLDGEDIDLCWKIKSRGWKIVYYPEVSITHIKKGTKSKFKSLARRMAGVNSMEIFYRKRLWKKYPLLINVLVIIGIKFMRLVRMISFIFK